MGQTRGRRREKKEKKEAAAENELDADFIPLEPVDENLVEPSDGLVRDNRASFFGLLDRAELEYFKNAENMLATNALMNEEREVFVTNVFEEARGKELKLATNQVCSKLFERLVQLANEEQIKQLVQAVEPFCVDLAFQKFSSHCLEAVITKAIQFPSCTETLVALAKRLGEASEMMSSDGYASHVLSTLLLTLSGVNASLRSKKSKLARKYTEIESPEEHEKPTVKEIPPELKAVGREIVNKLANLDKVTARRLAIDGVTTSLVQALVISEAQLMSNYSLVDNIIFSDDASGFISHCTTDSIGTHFLETVVKTLPAKKMNKFLELLPLEKLSSNENESSNYLLQSILTKSHLSLARKQEIIHKTLGEAIGQNVPVSVAALDVDFDGVAKKITDNLDFKTLNFNDTRRSAFVEKLSKYGPFMDKATEYIIALDDKDVAKMGVDPTQSYMLQSLLRPEAPLVARRKLINKFIVHVPQFVVNAYGSHIVDSLWQACFKLKFARERVANELLRIEEQVKHSPYGHKVWKNWQMEKYSRKRHEWWRIVKADEDSLTSQLGLDKKTPPAQLSSSSSSSSSHKNGAPSTNAQGFKKRRH